MELLLWLIAVMALLLASTTISVVVSTSWKLGDPLTRQQAWDEHYTNAIRQNPDRAREAIRARSDLHQALRQAISQQPVSEPQPKTPGRLR